MAERIDRPTAQPAAFQSGIPANADRPTAQAPAENRIAAALALKR